MIRFLEELIKKYSVQPRLGTFENAIEIAHFLEKQFEGFYELKSIEKYSATFVDFGDCRNENFELKIYFNEERDGYRSEIWLGIKPDIFHAPSESKEFIKMCKELYILEDIQSFKGTYYRLRKKFPEIDREYLKEVWG